MQTHETTAAPKPAKDQVASTLHRVSQNVFITVFGLLPIFFLPIAFAPFEYSKILLVIIGVMISVIFFSLSVLRSGTITLHTPGSMLLMWLIPVSALVSALLSGDVSDSMIGDTFVTQSALFLTLLAFITTAVTLVMGHKYAIMRFYMVLLGVSIVLAVFHVIRILFGAGALSFGVFNSSVATPLGSWNDLGLFFGLAVILSLVALEQLPLTKPGRITIGVISGLSLVVLSVVNFFAVWLVLGFVSLIMLTYSLSKDRFGDVTSFVPGDKATSIASIVVSIAVFIVSFIFIIGGPAVGGRVAELTGVSYIEVRPSLSATADIAQSVYAENAFLGIGPNKFVDAWRLHKDPSINQTIFWATDFTTGNGYISTLFVTTGVLGVIAWLVFFGSYLRTGARMLFASHTGGDKLMFFIATSSFISSVYLWGLSFIYVPSATMLILAALFTGITFSVYGSLLKHSTRTVVFGRDRRTGFALVASIMILIVGSVTTMYVTGRHYSASYVFAEGLSSISDGTSLEEIERSISTAYDLSQSDVYARQVAGYQIARMNALLGLAEPTPEQQQQFQAAVANGINAAQLAVDTDGSDATNWATLGSVFSVIAAAGIEGSYERAKEAFAQARALDPNNPAHMLNEAQLESRNGNLEAAKTLVEDAIRLRPRYTEAVLFLSQLEVAAGNIEGAINSTIASVQLEPNNPFRYYQLGVLYSSNGDLENATAAFEAAVARDESFSNARYFLALAYAEQGRTDEAKAQLERVAELNPDNTDIPTLISQIESGAITPQISEEAPEQIDEVDPVSIEGEQVITDDVPDSPLVSPVNPGVGTSDTDTTIDTGTPAVIETTESVDTTETVPATE